MWGQGIVLPALMELLLNRTSVGEENNLQSTEGQAGGQGSSEHICRVCPHHCSHPAHTSQGLLALSALVRHCAPGMAAFRASGGVPHLVTLCADADSRVQR